MTRLLETCWRARRRRGDEGVSLLLAIIFVFVVGTVAAALLPYTQAGIKTADTVRSVRTVQNAVDGAMDRAIQTLRPSLTLGTKPSCASGGSITLPSVTYSNPTPDTGVTTARVSYCNTAPTTSPTDQPPYAIQTLVKGVTVDGGAPLVVSGGILAAGDVAVEGNSSQSLNVDGDVYATGNCGTPGTHPADPWDLSTLKVGGEEHCSNTATSYAAPPDPDPTVDPFASPAVDDPFAASGLPSSASSVDPVGTCSSSTSVVTFSPGFYSMPPQPDSDSSSPTVCSGPNHQTWWFQPGMYYFDFPDGAFSGYNNDDADFSTGVSQNKTIIAGTPLGWDPAVDTANAVANMFKNGPGNTDHSALCDISQAGSTFVLGGPTNLKVATSGSDPSQVEICPGTVGTQQISVFGLRASDGASRATTPTGPDDYPEPNAASSTYANPDFAKATGDSQSAIAQLAGDPLVAPDTATLTLSGTPDLSGIPNGSLIISAQLRLDYTTTVVGNPNNVSNSLTYSSDVLPSTTVPNLPKDSPVGGKLIDLGLTGSPSWRVLKDSVKHLSLLFTADGSHLHTAETAISSVDDVQLEVSYVKPALEQVRCLNGVTTSPCNIVTNNVDDTIFLHGTSYTPLSTLEVAVHNYSSTVFERGVIAAQLVAHVSASTKQTFPPFQLPQATKPRIVRFTAESLEPNGTWKTRLVALVRYGDVILQPGGASTVAAGHTVKVLEWTVMR